MKITLVNHSDTLGGASVVTFRLMEALRRLGHDARMLVTDRRSGSDAVCQAAPRWRSRLPFLAEHARIFSANGFRRDTLFKISIATDGLPLSRHPLVREADAVNLNWVNQGMLSLDEVARIGAERPLSWTMHDMWNTTGICHHAGSCEAFRTGCHDCPLLGTKAGPAVLSARTFSRKAALYASVPIRFIAVSRWLALRCSAGALISGREVPVLNCPLPVEEFCATPTTTRAQAGLPPEPTRLILMAAARLDDPVKGLPHAIAALNGVAARRPGTAAVLVGSIRDAHTLDDLKMPYISTGMIADPEHLRQLYAHADIVLSSSLFETFGATLVEGQAAGCTPVGLIHDGRADIITDGVTGYAASCHERLADALLRALDAPIPADDLRRAAMRFSADTIASRFLTLIR